MGLNHLVSGTTTVTGGGHQEIAVRSQEPSNLEVRTKKDAAQELRAEKIDL